ncbi:MAG: phage antirepressor KilAC domain-containing protein [Fusobacteriaceae bacterium]
MNKLIVQIENNNGINVVSSRVVAEQLGKEHSDVMRKIKEVLGVGEFSESSYVNSQNKVQPEFLLAKDGFILLCMNYQGYNDFKRAYINKFNEMEKELKKAPASFKEALQLALEQQEHLELLETENKVKDQQILELKPKATYYDLVLQCKNLIPVTIIAKDFGMSGKRLNDLLNKLGVQYKQGGEVWLLYQKYADKGYTHTKTQNYNKSDGTQGVKTHTYWTQTGRLFIYDLLKKNSMLPNIEKEYNNVLKIAK